MRAEDALVLDLHLYLSLGSALPIVCSSVCSAATLSGSGPYNFASTSSIAGAVSEW